MITLTRTTNSIELDFDGNEVHYVSPESSVQGKSGANVITIADLLQGGNSRRAYTLSTLEINGRPADDGAQVAEWLRDTYFFGQDFLAGSGINSGATEAKQDTQIARADTMIVELGDIETELIGVNTKLTSIDNKTPNPFVTEAHDSREITYRTTGNGIGEIDYVRFMSGVAEVARLTFTYDANDDLIDVVKT